MKKEKLRKLYQKLKSENGAVMIVEASFVFPIMFYVIFFLIFFGNMYVIKSAVSRYTSTAAIRGAEYYSNPWVKPVTEELQGKDVPTKKMKQRTLLWNMFKEKILEMLERLWKIFLMKRQEISLSHYLKL